MLSKKENEFYEATIQAIAAAGVLYLIFYFLVR